MEKYNQHIDQRFGWVKKLNQNDAMKIVLDIEETLVEEQIAMVLKNVADGIINEEYMEQMDGSYRFETIHGPVWMEKE